VANLFSPGDRVVVPVAGYFGERFAKIAAAFGQDVRTVDYEWGIAVRPEDVRAAIREAPTKAVLVQHSETSTGVVNDIAAIAEVTREAGVLLVVDGISSLGAVPYYGDGWGVDVCVGGSQKAFSATPGLAFVSISDAAWEATATATNPRFYFDWRLYKASYDLPSPENPFTPAISLVLGLRAALRRFFDEGPDEVLARHELLSQATKEASAPGAGPLRRAPGPGVGGDRGEGAEGIDGDALVAKVRADHRIILAPGQGPMKGKVFRIGHLGYYDRFDIIRCLPRWS
jgi:aspartate aminotransferase-like enzyme